MRVPFQPLYNNFSGQRGLESRCLTTGLVSIHGSIWEEGRFVEEELKRKRSIGEQKLNMVRDQRFQRRDLFFTRVNFARRPDTSSRSIIFEYANVEKGEGIKEYMANGIRLNTWLMERNS